MKNLRQSYPLAFALAAAALAVVCFQVVPADAIGINAGGDYYGTLAQAALAATVVFALYVPSGGCTLAQKPEGALRTRMLVGVLVAAGVAVGAAKVVVQGSRMAVLPVDVVFVAMLLATAVFEEVLFRGFLFEGIAKMYERTGMRTALLWAAIWSSVLFGILHISSDLGSLFRLTAWLQAVAKVAQGALFGLAMCALYAKARSILPCVLVHFAFDVASELPIFMATGIQTSTYITGSPADLAIVAVCVALFVLPAKWAGDYFAKAGR